MALIPVVLSSTYQQQSLIPQFPLAGVACNVGDTFDNPVTLTINVPGTVVVTPWLPITGAVNVTYVTASAGQGIPGRIRALVSATTASGFIAWS